MAAAMASASLELQLEKRDKSCSDLNHQALIEVGGAMAHAGKRSDIHGSRRSQSIRISQAMTAYDNWLSVSSQAESQLSFLHSLIRVIIS